METEILTDNQDKEVASELPSIWGIFNFKVPWNLPVVHPSSKGQACKVHENVVENAEHHSLFNQFSPGNSVSLPWPWSILLNLILLKESKFSSVNEPVKHVEEQNHGGSHGTNIKSEKLCLGQLVTLWQPSASLRFFFGHMLNLIGLNLAILNIRHQASHYLWPDVFGVSR
jgi:hypothetical protein